MRELISISKKKKKSAGRGVNRRIFSPKSSQARKSHSSCVLAIVVSTCYSFFLQSKGKFLCYSWTKENLYLSLYLLLCPFLYVLRLSSAVNSLGWLIGPKNILIGRMYKCPFKNAKTKQKQRRNNNNKKNRQLDWRFSAPSPVPHTPISSLAN